MTKFSMFTDDELDDMESAFYNKGLRYLICEIRTERRRRILDRLMKQRARNEDMTTTVEIKTVTNEKEAEAYPINEDIKKGFEEFTKMMFKSEVEE